MKVATVMRYAPADVKNAIRPSAHSIGDDYKVLKSLVQAYVMSGTSFDAKGVAVLPGAGAGAGKKKPDDGGLQPMDVGAIKGKDKGRGKDKGKTASWRRPTTSTRTSRASRR